MCRNYHQVIVLDHVITSGTALIVHLEHTLGGQVSSVETQRPDLVDDTIAVGARFRVPRHIPVEFETTTVFDDIASTVQLTAEPTGAVAREAQTVQPWNGMCLNTAQTGSRSESVEAQPLTMAPAV